MLATRICWALSKWAKGNIDKACCQHAISDEWSPCAVEATTGFSPNQITNAVLSSAWPVVKPCPLNISTKSQESTVSGRWSTLVEVSAFSRHAHSVHLQSKARPSDPVCAPPPLAGVPPGCDGGISGSPVLDDSFARMTRWLPLLYGNIKVKLCGGTGGMLE